MMTLQWILVGMCLGVWLMVFFVVPVVRTQERRRHGCTGDDCSHVEARDEGL